jgi:hypothetical protein
VVARLHGEKKKKQAGLSCAGLGLGEKLGRAREERERGGAGRTGKRKGAGWAGRVSRLGH